MVQNLAKSKGAGSHIPHPGQSCSAETGNQSFGRLTDALGALKGVVGHEQQCGWPSGHPSSKKQYTITLVTRSKNAPSSKARSPERSVTGHPLHAKGGGGACGGGGGALRSELPRLALPRGVGSKYLGRLLIAVSGAVGHWICLGEWAIGYQIRCLF